MFEHSYCININDEEVETSKTLDRYSIIEMISKYNKELASVINKWVFVKLNIQKQKKHMEFQIFNYSINWSIW